MTVFVDTNVFVYALDSSEPTKQPHARAWIEHLWMTRAGSLSAQVLHELYVTVTRKLQPGMPAADARGVVRELMAWRPLALDHLLVEAAWSLQDRYELSLWDALVVAAAHRCQCRYLLSEDLADGQDYWGTTVVDPFRHAPSEVPL